ncbi:response regulator receiver modulated diguanylate cyclase/phosphodiesterase [Desulfocicer vacuolatum DSM 3385]|uniref:Response regulator receiver modulated diguanylate cyclase/phosphodiesterase n=1 Tax=Desulfocicer vacuolatum DSM 3385 TaxID=1121400 RepID=A0A1W2EIE9_9BACT|nr:EAL domain-containing protein [Desulfocicer vacuolatum]SMD09507.1 response regulator receiver modulated diguanylate cyclase/phosphodiesterase [Desulfocicer vacuolatum DSM 3385]
MKSHDYCPCKRILVIDDKSSTHQDFCKILMKSHGSSHNLDELEPERFGDEGQPMISTPFEIDCASQGKEGLTMLQKARSEGRPYALAFVDARMPPGWDAIETICHLWKACPDLQVVLCTAHSGCSWQKLRHQLGETDGLLILKKPFDSIEVLQLAHALTRKWELNREVQGRLAQLAFYDNLTGLPNRTLFLARLTKYLEKASHAKHKAALLFIDLDNFKRINDTLGHSVGDDLLQTTSQRLIKCLRVVDSFERPSESDMAARLGGDEFTVVLPELKKKGDAGMVARRIVDHIGQPMQLGKHQIVVTPSIGIAIFPDDGDTVELLLKNADIAMYFSKRMGPNMFSYYQASMNTPTLKRMTIENHLHRAFDGNEFELYYQPQFDLITGTPTGVEALLRWHNRELGEVPPMEFIPMAEDSGMIVAIGEWVMRTACRQAQTWLDRGLPLGRIAINVSSKQFIHPGFVEMMKRILLEIKLPPGLLEIEILEELIRGGAREIIETLNALKQMNIRIAVDDFGSGYSSLACLEETDIDCLKIDSVFVGGISGGKVGRSVVSGIIAMAEEMDMRVIAEGVETKEQAAFLRKKQCQEVQGYLFSRPMSTPQVETFLLNNLGFKSVANSGLDHKLGHYT